MYPVFRKDNYRVAWGTKYVFKDLLDLPVQFASDIKHCFQRIHKGYSDADVTFIEDWFLNTVPDMLQEIKEDTIGYPVELCVREDHDCKKCDRDCRKEWEKILDRMIHLFREAYEPTKENPYEKEIEKIYEIFWAKYGVCGERLNTEEDKKDGCIRWYTPPEHCRMNSQDMLSSMTSTWPRCERLISTRSSARMRHWICLRNGFGV